jgi:hypothetical protein
MASAWRGPASCLALGLVTPEVFERAFGLLAYLYQEQ